MPLLVDLLGWAGAVALLSAYWLVSTRRTHGAAISYQVLNLLGSILVLANSLYYGAYPSVAVNGVWILIGLYAITTASRLRQ
jgi:hypothetical protein